MTFQNRTIKLNESSKRWPKGGQGFGVQVRLIYGLYVSALLFVKVFKNNTITRNPDYYCVKPPETKKSPPEGRDFQFNTVVIVGSLKQWVFTFFVVIYFDDTHFGKPENIFPINNLIYVFIRTILFVIVSTIKSDIKTNLILLDSSFQFIVLIGHPLTEEQKERNRRKSKVRSRVEHVFGFMEQTMGGLIFRGVGLIRAKANIALTNLVYNMCRLVQIKKYQPTLMTVQ